MKNIIEITENARKEVNELHKKLEEDGFKILYEEVVSGEMLIKKNGCIIYITRNEVKEKINNINKK